MINKRLLWILLLFFLASTQIASGDDWYDEYGKYYKVYDVKSEEIIFEIARDVTNGDQYLSEDNKMYKITRVNRRENVAYAEFIEEITLPEIDEEAFKIVMRAIQENANLAQALLAQQQTPTVGIYTTHTGESYLPTDGNVNVQGKGGIVRVAEKLKEGFEKNGVEALLDDTSHVPHDAGAYNRSRRTALQLLRNKQPGALIDVHRDAIPAQRYLTEINGQPAAKIRMVVGRSNQNFKANEELSWKIKAVADKMYPGLIKDIFYGRGNYNQDLTPRAILAEIGTYEHTRQRAERSAGYFADVLTAALFTGTFRDQQGQPEQVRPQQASNRGAGSGITGALLLIVGGGLAYLFFSSGGKELRSKISHFKQEFNNFLGRVKNKK